MVKNEERLENTHDHKYPPPLGGYWGGGGHLQKYTEDSSMPTRVAAHSQDVSTSSSAVAAKIAAARSRASIERHSSKSARVSTAHLPFT